VEVEALSAFASLVLVFDEPTNKINFAKEAGRRKHLKRRVFASQHAAIAALQDWPERNAKL
jgi:hypothetical protein